MLLRRSVAAGPVLAPRKGAPGHQIFPQTYSVQLADHICGLDLTPENLHLQLVADLVEFIDRQEAEWFLPYARHLYKAVAPGKAFPAALTVPRRGAFLIFLPGLSALRDLATELRRRPGLSGGSSSQWLVLPVHSQLSAAEQRAIFRAPPEGCRKVVLATNIAETSITIDDCLYVIDTGRVKRLYYNAAHRLPSLRQVLISAAEATQRAGRAGRVAPGFVFHILPRVQVVGGWAGQPPPTPTSAASAAAARDGSKPRASSRITTPTPYLPSPASPLSSSPSLSSSSLPVPLSQEDLIRAALARVVVSRYPEPEIRRAPLDQLCLTILAMGNTDPLNFFAAIMDPPRPTSVLRTLWYLERVGAVRWIPTASEGPHRRRRHRAQAAPATASSSSPSSTAASPLTSDSSGPGVELKSEGDDPNQYELTILGEVLARLPLSPALGKVLVLGSVFGVLGPSLTLAASLAGPRLYLTAFDPEVGAQYAAERAKYAVVGTDHLTTVHLVQTWMALARPARAVGLSGPPPTAWYGAAGKRFAASTGLSHTALREIAATRLQLFQHLQDARLVPELSPDETDALLYGADTQYDPRSLAQTRLLLGILAGGLYPNICQCLPIYPTDPGHIDYDLPKTVKIFPLTARALIPDRQTGYCPPDTDTETHAAVDKVVGKAAKVAKARLEQLRLPRWLPSRLGQLAAPEYCPWQQEAVGTAAHSVVRGVRALPAGLRHPTAFSLANSIGATAMLRPRDRPSGSPWAGVHAVYLAKFRGAQVILSDASLVAPIHLALFCGDLSVLYHRQLLYVDGLIAFSVPAKAAVAVRRLRRELDRLIADRLAHVTATVPAGRRARRADRRPDRSARAAQLCKALNWIVSEGFLSPTNILRLQSQQAARP